MLGRGRALFLNRREAGKRLALALDRFKGADPLVLALPRGGVPVAFEVARQLDGDLDLLIVRKIGAPGQPELGLGAVVDGSDPQVIFNDAAMDIVRPSESYIASETQKELEEIERRRRVYLAGRKPVPTRGRTVLLVDDGVATGGTVRTALKALRRAGAGRVVLAVPVAPSDSLASLRDEFDEVICLEAPEPFLSVGSHYVDFAQTSDEEVVRLLEQSRPVASA